MFRFLLSTGLILVSCAVSASPLLVNDVNGYSLDSKGGLIRFDALLMDEGRVVALGDEAITHPLAKKARYHSGQGNTLLPGLIDAHAHVMGLGFALRNVDLVGTTSLGEALSRIKLAVEGKTAGEWIVGRGWNHVLWAEGRFPTAKALDEVTGDHPAWLSRVDGHSGWANSAALKAAGIDRHTPDPVGGAIERDEHGEATGILIDTAMELVTSKIPEASDTEKESALKTALATMAEVGLTSVHDAGVDADTIALFQRFAEKGTLSTRIYAMVAGTGDDFDRVAANGPVLDLENDRLVVRAVKLVADGALGSRGAAMLAPYSDDPKNYGLRFHRQEALVAMMGKAISKGFQVNVHAIGDGGNRQVLDAYSMAYQQYGGRDLRHRMEHAQIVSLGDIARFIPLQLIASMQPTHATSDMNMAENRVGPERIAGAYAWQRFLSQGTVIAGGSDFPVEAPSPFFGLHAAITRQNHQGAPEGGWYPDQRLSLIQAFKAFTLDAAYAAHQEARLGTLEPGKWADFILVDRDIFEASPSTLWNTRVLETWVAGEQVYSQH